MNGLVLPSREALRERILPGDDFANTRWLYSVIVGMCYHKGQVECSPAKLRSMAGFDAVKSIWPMLQHLEELKLILLEAQYFNNSRQPSNVRIALAGQQVEPFATRRQSTANNPTERNCTQCNALYCVDVRNKHRAALCYKCYRAEKNRYNSRRQAKRRALKAQLYQESIQVAS